MARRLRVSVDHNKCVGSTICVLTAPNVFVLNEKGQSTVVNPDGDTETRIVRAAEQCPLSAITVDDAETGERLFPSPDSSLFKERTSGPRRLLSFLSLVGPTLHVVKIVPPLAGFGKVAVTLSPKEAPA